VTVAILVTVLIAVVVLGVGAAMTNVGQWYRNLRKPTWNPPFGARPTAAEPAA
jgi:tryptophan-rich sensory protein